MALETLVDLVNDWGSIPRAAAGRSNDPYPRRPAGISRGTTSQDLCEVADTLFPAFEQATDSAKVARHLDELLNRVRIRPALFTRGDQVTTGWRTDEPDQLLLAGAVLAMREYLADHPVSRLGVCTGRRCADVYIDASPGAHRRFCSLTCQNRARVSAFRARQGHTAR